MKTDFEYEIEAKKYISDLPVETQGILIVAIEDLFEQNSNINWRFINTALHKKSKQNWINYKAGLLFNPAFQASTFKQMEREDEASNLDTSNFFEILVKGNLGECNE